MVNERLRMATTTLSMSSTTSLSRRSLASELRALRAVFWKEWTIFRRYPAWIIGFFLWPVIFPAAYILSARALAGPDGGSLALFAQAAGTSDYIGFIAVGTTMWMWQNVVLWGVGFALRNEQLKGTLESNWLTPTWRFSFLLGNGLMQFVEMVFFILVAALQFGLLFGVRLNGDPLLVVVMFLATAPSIYGLGFAFASLVITAKEANAFVYLVRGLVMIFCGITFPVSVLPDWMQAISGWLPATYAIRGIRKAALAGADLPELLPDLIPLVLFGLAWLVIGYLMFNFMERRARRTGAIGQY